LPAVAAPTRQFCLQGGVGLIDRGEQRSRPLGKGFGEGFEGFVQLPGQVFAAAWLARASVQVSAMCVAVVPKRLERAQLRLQPVGQFFVQRAGVLGNAGDGARQICLQGCVGRSTVATSAAERCSKVSAQVCSVPFRPAAGFRWCACGGPGRRSRCLIPW
jgi:hypothetical protein